MGRIEVKADRRADQLTILNVWPEPGVEWTNARIAKLQSELARLARFVSVNEILWQAP